MPKSANPAIFMQADVADYVVVTATIAPPYCGAVVSLDIPSGIPQAFMPCSLPVIFPGIPQSTFFPIPSGISEAAGRLWDEMAGVMPPESDYE